MKQYFYLTVLFVLIFLTTSCQLIQSSRDDAPAEREVTPDFDAYSQVIPGTDVPIEMVPVPGGTFMMGRASDEEGKQPHEGPQKSVAVDDFWMSKHLITWDQYDYFLQESLDRLEAELSLDTLERLGIPADAFSIPSPPYEDETYGMGSGRSGYPAISITHFAAIEYAKWLSAQTGKFYRLATEAEWEYACRAGSQTVYAHGDDPELLDEYEWFRGNSNRSYQRVGQKNSNAFGLYDMQGNVMEWVMDQYFDDYHDRLEGGTAVNPWFKPDELYPRTVRGASWHDEAADVRCTKRRGSTGHWSRSDPQIPKSAWWHTNAPFVGFRIVRPAQKPEPEEIEQFWIDPMLDF